VCGSPELVRKRATGRAARAALVLPTSSITPPIQLGRSLADSIHAPRPTATRTRLRPHLLQRHLAQNQQSTLVHKISLRLHPNLVSLRPMFPKERSAWPLGHPILLMARSSHTVGRPSPFSAGARHGFFSGSSTAAAKALKGRTIRHGCTQSPVAHRREHRRPVM
jgi:hypothetical protein